MKKQSFVYVLFPKTGLGNLLLVWSRAKLFSHLNNLPLITTGWWGIRWGSWMRNENKKRLYRGYFHESSLTCRTTAIIRKRNWPVEEEPAVQKYPQSDQPVVFCFQKPAIQNDLFRDIRPYRSFIKEEILNLLRPSLQAHLQKIESPQIAAHIRRGDFKLGNPITPTRFFIDCIEFIRRKTKKELKVTVFTDADRTEIGDVLALENVWLADEKPDILDILQMSKSRVIILSRSSTFSYWAAFLSDAIVIKPKDDWQESIRPTEINEYRFEGKVNFDEPLSLATLSLALEKETW